MYDFIKTNDGWLVCIGGNYLTDNAGMAYHHELLPAPVRVEPACRRELITRDQEGHWNRAV